MPRVSASQIVRESLTDYIQGFESRLIRLCIELGAANVPGDLSHTEDRLLERAAPRAPERRLLRSLREALARGDDPLGGMVCILHPHEVRRGRGAFYTPATIAKPMVEWLLRQDVARVVDPGCGSGRFATAFARRSPKIPVYGIELDPLSSLVARANVAALKLRNVVIVNDDYLRFDLPPANVKTGFIGNPPYVRHHALRAKTKQHGLRTAAALDHVMSSLSGLHVHFLVATAAKAQPGDVGCFITSAEWLDVNYGAVMRDLFLNGLGGRSVLVFDPTTSPFPGVEVTAAVMRFVKGSTAARVEVDTISSATGLRAAFRYPNRTHDRRRLANTKRWSLLLDKEGPMPPDAPTLSSIAAVHRGTATGANKFFIMTREQARQRGIEKWCKPVITRAREIIEAKGVVRDGPGRMLVLDAPADVDRAANPALDAYLRDGERDGAGAGAVAERYLTSKRGKAWWNIGAVAPPIVATYMARQPPTFAANPDGLVLLNIGHGVYPKAKLSPKQIADFVKALNAHRDAFGRFGRTYFGALSKFEPREMAALPLPPELASKS